MVRDQDEPAEQERPRESEPNPTQERMDKKGDGDRVVDAPWTEDEDAG
ncbi:MAG TPA: hypothetical protein VFL41_13930 [Gaiellaceae bacterium]|nr:hypothetical protein [Gaiellaceae bacterium]